MKIKYLIIACFCIVQAIQLSAQNGDVQQVQPSIMVIPWTAQSENVMDKIDNDFTYRAILNKIKGAFDERGYTTYDFISAFNNAKIDRALKWDKVSSIFQDIANNSPADIYIKADMKAVDKGGSSVVYILLEAVNNYTNESLANRDFNSREIRTNDMVMLAQSALTKENAIDGFLNLLNEKFRDIRENGRVVTIVFSVAEDSEVDFDTEVGEDYDLLSDIITEWLRENAYQDYVDPGNTDATGFNVKVKIPLRSTDGTNYDVNDLANPLRKYVAGLGTQTDYGERLRVSRSYKGSNIYITINTQ